MEDEWYIILWFYLDKLLLYKCTYFYHAFHFQYHSVMGIISKPVWGHLFPIKTLQSSMHWTYFSNDYRFTIKSQTYLYHITQRLWQKSGLCSVCLPSDISWPQVAGQTKLPHPTQGQGHPCLPPVNAKLINGSFKEHHTAVCPQLIDVFWPFKTDSPAWPVTSPLAWLTIISKRRVGTTHAPVNLIMMQNKFAEPRMR